MPVQTCSSYYHYFTTLLLIFIFRTQNLFDPTFLKRWWEKYRHCINIKISGLIGETKSDLKKNPTHSFNKIIKLNFKGNTLFLTNMRTRGSSRSLKQITLPLHLTMYFRLLIDGMSIKFMIMINMTYFMSITKHHVHHSTTTKTHSDIGLFLVKFNILKNTVYLHAAYTYGINLGSV